MASENFEYCLKQVLVHEGGYVDHPKDPGGATNKGITIATYRKWIDKDGTKDDLRDITDEQVAKVYRKAYWNVVRGDDLPNGVDYAVFDFGVNSGPSRAAKYLQAVLGVEQDGKIGPNTIVAAKSMSSSAIIDGLCSRRMKFLEALGTFPVFGKGWTRRVNEVRTKALGLAVASPTNSINNPKPSTGHIGPEVEDEDPIPMPEQSSAPPAWAIIFGVALVVVFAAIGFIVKG